MNESKAEILLVEDDPRDAKLTIPELEGESPELRIEIAGDGEEAFSREESDRAESYNWLAMNQTPPDRIIGADPR
jgi:CheY-like chemotaxis protein